MTVLQIKQPSLVTTWRKGDYPFTIVCPPAFNTCNYSNVIIGQLPSLCGDWCGTSEPFNFFFPLLIALPSLCCCVLLHCTVVCVGHCGVLFAIPKLSVGPDLLQQQRFNTKKNGLTNKLQSLCKLMSFLFLDYLSVVTTVVFLWDFHCNCFIQGWLRKTYRCFSSIPISLVDKWRFDCKRWGGMGPCDHGRPGVGV